MAPKQGVTLILGSLWVSKVYRWIQDSQDVSKEERVL